MTDTLNQVAWPHAGRMAATICETNWDALLAALPVLDGYLPTELMAAAAHLQFTDALATATLKVYRVGKVIEVIPEAQVRQVIEAETALANCGYLHPSRVSRLNGAVQQAVAERHEARGAVGDLLFQARTVIEDA
ncbi:hypothetical protein LO763_11720 [Glycomyces sp. A-F 0318]|uniref:hypothetical protein n=1 Tax=Glycomyces amatae TaxID=2881355 RepID=UPI001E34678C|nr:hypothetical protein [Glycomyces amatae]MCD0444290.1 hypothetical protein [Glycomyces amatae]